MFSPLGSDVNNANQEIGVPHKDVAPEIASTNANQEIVI